MTIREIGMSAKLVLVLLATAMVLPVKAAPTPAKPSPDAGACFVVFREAESRYSDARNAVLTIIVAKASDDLEARLTISKPSPARSNNAAFRQCVRSYIAHPADRATLLEHLPF